MIETSIISDILQFSFRGLSQEDYQLLANAVKALIELALKVEKNEYKKLKEKQVEDKLPDCRLREVVEYLKRKICEFEKEQKELNTTHLEIQLACLKMVLKVVLEGDVERDV